MSTGSVQRRNDEMVSLLESDFCRWREFVADGARLLSAVQATHRQGGGLLRWGWMADSQYLHGQAAVAATHLTAHNIASVDYFATANGGPYVDFDGAIEYYDAGDNAWAEIGTDDFFIWQWCKAAALDTNNRAIVSKWGAVNNYQWHLHWDLANLAFEFEVSANGLAISTVTSTYAETTGVWYYVGGYFTPSDANGLRVYVGAAADAALTVDSAASPVSVFTGGVSDFEIGSQNGGASLWEGGIGVGNGRANVPTGAGYAGIDGYAARLFHMTRWKYMA